MEKEKINFWCNQRSCIKSCDSCNEKGDLVIEVEKGSVEEFKCGFSEEHSLKRMGKKVSGYSGLKLSSTEIRKDRLHRSKEDFKKNILPTFKEGSDELKHFSKK